MFLLLFAFAVSGKTLVLMYHQFDPNPKSKYAISPDYFSRHIDEIRDEGFAILSFDEAIGRLEAGDTSSAPEVLITMDDGWSGVYDYAYPILKEKDATAVAFIYPRAISFGYRGFCTWEEIVEMDRSGVVKIQSHALTHSALKKYSGENYLHFLWRIEGELFASKYILENELGHPVRAIAYPFGAFSRETESTARRIGYDFGFSCRSPFSSGFYSRMTIPRYEISRGMSSIRSLLRRFKDVYATSPPLTMQKSGPLGVDINQPGQIVKGMSIRELIGQIIFVGLGKKPSNKDLRELFVENAIGGLVLDVDFLEKTDSERMEEVLEIVHSLPAIPPLYAIRDIDAKRYEYMGSNLDIGSAGLTSMREIGRSQGKALSSKGIHLLIGPEMNVRPGEQVMYSATDGYPAPTAGGLVGQANAASFLIQGLQDEGVLCVVRDFPGHDVPTSASEPITVVAHSYDVLRGRELVAFASAAVAGAGGFLIGHIQYPGIDSLPVAQSEFFHSVIRDSLGFTGMVVCEDVTWEAAGSSPQEAAVRALRAGTDGIIVGDRDEIDDVVNGMVDAVQTGKLTRTRLEDAATKILIAKKKLGIIK